jgi:hypothetical protein
MFAIISSALAFSIHRHVESVRSLKGVVQICGLLSLICWYGTVLFIYIEQGFFLIAGICNIFWLCTTHIQGYTLWYSFVSPIYVAQMRNSELEVTKRRMVGATTLCCMFYIAFGGSVAYFSVQPQQKKTYNLLIAIMFIIYVYVIFTASCLGILYHIHKLRRLCIQAVEMAAREPEAANQRDQPLQQHSVATVVEDRNGNPSHENKRKQERRLTKDNHSASTINTHLEEGKRRKLINSHKQTNIQQFILQSKSLRTAVITFFAAIFLTSLPFPVAYFAGLECLPFSWVFFLGMGLATPSLCIGYLFFNSRKPPRKKSFASLTAGSKNTDKSNNDVYIAVVIANGAGNGVENPSYMEALPPPAIDLAS